MFSSSSSLAGLVSAPIRPGRVVWMGLRPMRRGAMQNVDQIVCSVEQGLVGDHYAGRSGKRQVTLIQAEDLSAIASALGLDTVAPASLRRNLVTQGVNLVALKGFRFQLGEAIFDVTDICAPCSRMEETFGEGGYNAVRGRGGITARVVQGGVVRLGDLLTRVDG